ncbi:hypothetical protein AXX16_0799 [Serratia rubidaea]|nr:hypothetical protein AXX16_0799 [Serratia rubidaea]
MIKIDNGQRLSMSSAACPPIIIPVTPCSAHLARKGNAF